MENVPLTIRLDSTEPIANARAVAATIDAFATVVEELSRQLHPEREVLLRAHAFEDGSFEIPLDVLAGGVVTASLLAGSPFVNTVLDKVKQFLEVKKLLRGKPLPPQTRDGGIEINGGTVHIENCVINVVSNQQVTEAFDRAAVEIKKDPSVRGVEVLRGEDRELLGEIPLSQLEYFEQRAFPIDADQTRREKTVRTILIIRAPTLVGDSKWKFNFGGRQISAKILDDEFSNRVKTGMEQFSAGDRLQADLRIVEEYNTQLADFEQKLYFVDRVISHERRPGNSSRDLFEGEA